MREETNKKEEQVILAQGKGRVTAGEKQEKPQRKRLSRYTFIPLVSHLVGVKIPSGKLRVDLYIFLNDNA